MAREIEGALFRVNTYGSRYYVECSSRDDLIDFCAREVAQGQVILGVNEMCMDGSTPKVPVLTDKQFKKLVNVYQDLVEKDVQDELRVVRTMDELRDYLEDKGWTVYGDEEGWEVRQASPAGEDFFFDVWHNNDVKKAIDALKEYAYDFDIDEHVKLNLGMRGAPGTAELVEDAKEIQKMLDDLADGVNWCEMQTIGESCKFGSLKEMIDDAEAKVCQANNYKTKQEMQR